MIERRLEIRLADTELVLVCWDENGTKLNQLGNVRDVSLGGIGILVGQPLPAGTSVTVTYGFGELMGTVRHSSQLVEGYFLGIEFAPESKNSSLHFQPELLSLPL